MQVQAVLYAVIPATSYYRFRGSTSFEIARGSYGQQRNSYSRDPIRENTGGIDLATYGGVRGKYSMNTLYLVNFTCQKNACSSS